MTARTTGPLAAFAAMLWFAGAGAQELQVIELRYRLADDVIPALQPLLEPGGVLTGLDSTLFVRTSAGNLEQIRMAVAALDRQPRQLLLSVGQGTVETSREVEVRGSVTVGGDDVQAGINRPPGDDSGTAVQARAGTQRADLQDVSSVRALEGTETFIAVGQSAPITTSQVTPGWPHTTVTQTTEYRDASTGFYAIARVSGSVVTLEISPRQQRFSGRTAGGRVETATVTTTVSGRLGDWIAVGAAGDSSHGDTGGPLTWGTRSAEARYAVWVKVEEVQ